MFSVLQYPAVWYPAATNGSPASSITSSAIRSRQHSQSHEGYLRPLARLLRNPTAALEKVLEDFTVAPSGEPALAEERENRRKLLYLKLRNAESFDEWRAAAFELDEIEGNNAWKSELESSDYDYRLLESRLRQLDEARTSGDPKRMLFLIRTSLTRFPGGIQNLRLYQHTHLGTKDLVERYIRSALDTMAALLDISQSNRDSGLEPRLLLEQVLAARQSFGRSALLLSGGATFGMNHIGVVKTLWETKLLPRIVSGASAGSIVSAVLCARTDEEMPALMDRFCFGNLDVFTREGEEGLLYKLSMFLKTGAIFDIENLLDVVRDLIGDLTFQEAYNRTRRILNICVSSASLYELPRLLNYVTAPNVIIWSAVAASVSVPLIFSASTLLAKDPKTGKIVPWNPSAQRLIDGSVDNDLPMTRLAEMFNVNHFIVSQVNPHVVPFLSKEKGQVASQTNANNPIIKMSSEWITTIANLAKDEALHRMQLLTEIGVFPTILTKAKSILSQKYSGDITILPEISMANLPKILSNPTPDFMLAAMLCGERATWPKLSRIQNHCAIELALDDTVQQLRARVAFSPSQVNLRINAFPRPLSRAGSDGGESRKVKHKKSRHRKSAGEHHGQSIRVPPISLTKASNISRALTSAPPFSKAEPGKQKAIFSLTPSGEDADDIDDDGTAFSSSSSPLSASDSEITTADDYFSSSTNDETLSPTPRRDVFRSTSQPTTSYQQTEKWYFSPAHKLPLSDRPPTPVQPNHNAPNSSKTPTHLTMTMTPSPSITSVSRSNPRPGAEAQYKAIFHPPRSSPIQHQPPPELTCITTTSPSRSNSARRGNRSRSNSNSNSAPRSATFSAAGSASGSGATTPRAPGVTLPSDTDLAAAQLRRKRSLSTIGLRGLRAPSYSNIGALK